LAWAAGIWDGEGSAFLSTTATETRRPRPVMNVTQACDSITEPPELLVRFHEAVGGLGRIRFRGVPPSRSSGVRPQWEWVCTRFEHIQAVTAMLWPWLTQVKRTQARRMLLEMRYRKPSAANVAARKLTAEQVQEIRRRFRPGKGMELAREFGVSRTLIGHIVAGRNYRGVTPLIG